MFINNQHRIDVQNDSIYSALLKKSDNTSLSKTTLSKLAKISNTTLGLTEAEAKKVFVDNKPINETPRSRTLAFALEAIHSGEFNPKVKNQIKGFIRNCNITPAKPHVQNRSSGHPVNHANVIPQSGPESPFGPTRGNLVYGVTSSTTPAVGQTKSVRFYENKYTPDVAEVGKQTISDINRSPASAPDQIKNMSTAEFMHAYAEYLGKDLGEGKQAFVVQDRQDNNKVIKIFHDNIEHEEIEGQASSFKKFYGEHSAQILSGRAIHMNKIEGMPLSQVKKFPDDAIWNFTNLISEMIKKGCPPTDMSENNFLYNERKNTFSPIDISLCKKNEFDTGGLQYILGYIEDKSCALN